MRWYLRRRWLRELAVAQGRVTGMGRSFRGRITVLVEHRVTCSSGDEVPLAGENEGR